MAFTCFTFYYRKFTAFTNLVYKNNGMFGSLGQMFAFWPQDSGLKPRINYYLLKLAQCSIQTKRVPTLKRITT